MINWMTLCALAENGTGPSRELDDAIWWNVCLKSGLYRDHEGFRDRDVSLGLYGDPDWRPLGPYDFAPEYTRKFDPILDLIKRELPSWDITLFSNPPTAVICPPSGLLSPQDAIPYQLGHKAASMPNALCAAFCHAISAL